MKQRDLATSLVCLTPPTEEPLTLAEAKAHLRVDSTDDDAYISSLIIVARQYAETYTARAISLATYLFSLDEFPDGQIVLPNPPVQSIESITYIDADGVEQSLGEGSYDVDFNHEPCRIAPAFNTSWPGTRAVPAAVKITFTAGYPGVGSGSAEESTIPASIKQACLLMIGHLYENREQVADRQMYEVPQAAQALLGMNSWGAL